MLFVSIKSTAQLLAAKQHPRSSVHDLMHALTEYMSIETSLLPPLLRIFVHSYPYGFLDMTGHELKDKRLERRLLWE